jgi:hypothetical protein
MRKIGFSLLSLLGLLFAALGDAQAQNITITPTMPYVAVGKTVQFSATVTGLSKTDVTWYSGGVVGGNTKAGKISTTGLYTAPATLPGQNPVQITAVSKVNTSVSATTYVNILSSGPKITAVSPNPLAVGTFTVTITGSGFKSGAEVYDTYGSNSLIQLVTLSVTSTTIKATGYQGPASSATFCVRNPGSDYSNSITVPVGGGASTYTLNVVNGTGGGSYAAGTVVTITAKSATTTLTMPAANATVTANYTSPGTYTLSVVNGSGSGAYTPGTVVTITANAPPAGQVFANWTGAAVANSTAATTTLTMPSANATVTANYTAAAVTIPYPVSSHPRLWVTTADLPRLQSWATATNPIYAQGMASLLQQAVTAYNTQFFPGGVPNSNYPDPGDVQGYTGLLTEQYGAILAFNSLIDPSPSARIQYAQDARNLLMVAMNQAALGHLANAPFRDPVFAVYNRANGSGEQWPLIVDWIYNAQDASGNPILTASDKATIRNVFLMWANDCLNASTTGGDHPSPIDPSDDPPVNTALPASALGNTLRSYILDANGAWLYQEFAMMGDPAAVAAGYGIQGNGAGFGLASGGLPPEGMLYGHSFGFVLGQLLALQTAGFNNPAYSGPQIQLIGAPVWDRFVTGLLSSLTPTPFTPASETWLGPVYQFASYGDLLRLYVTPDFIQPLALLALLDHQNGATAHDNAARWFGVNAIEGGASALLSRITDPWSWSSTQSILYYMLLDPAAPTATDPRPTFPTIFFDPAAGRILAHSDWTANGTMFDYRASWISINHQLGDGGQFELYRKGEWLTKEMSNYDNNALGMTTVYHNTLALQNWCANGTPNLQWYEAGEWANGSQWMEGDDAGDPTTVSSNGPGYVYATSDLTNLFNRPNYWTPSLGATDICQAVYAAGNLNPIAELEPTQYILTVQDPTLPTSARFLHVLQGADPGAGMAAATYVQSSNGTAFDGAVFNGSAVYFPVSSAATFTTTSFSAPTGVHTLLVTGLSVGASYGYTVQAGGAGNIVTLTPGGTGANADSAGVLRLTF